MRTRFFGSADPWPIAEHLAGWLNSQGSAKQAWAQREVEEVIAALRLPDGPYTEKRAATLEKFKQVETGWTITPDRKPITYINAATPIGTGLSLLSEVAKAEILDRLRRCKRCNKWFVARIRKKGFCSSACQIANWADYRKTSEGRRAQKLRMRRYRRKQRAMKKGGTSDGTLATR